MKKRHINPAEFRTGSSSPPKESPEKGADTFLDTTLRPSVWNDYVGQSAVKENLKILLGAARERKQPPEHVLFYGPPGLGKTTLAYLIAKEMRASIRVTSRPAHMK